MNYPFESARKLGTVVSVDSATVQVTLPRASDANDHWQHGGKFGFGRVGEFVLLEAEELALVGRITKVDLPNSDREMVDERMGVSTLDAVAIGHIRLLCGVSLVNRSVEVGIPRYPRIGSSVYAMLPEVFQLLTRKGKSSGSVSFDLATVTGLENVSLLLRPEHLFGRHCAVVGSSGGGKSFTLGRFAEEVSQLQSGKAILIDATGEFEGLKDRVKHVSIGRDVDGAIGCIDTCIPYSGFAEQDIVALFQPSGKIQLPKLREAIRHLKLVNITAAKPPKYIDNGIVKNNYQSKATLQSDLLSKARQIYKPLTGWRVDRLVEQINEFCKDDAEKSWCSSLVGRIENYQFDLDFACIFGSDHRPSLLAEILEFIKDPNASVLRISLKHLSFSYHVREIVVNAIGRYLLSLARTGCFKKRPIVILADEAHHFLNKWIGEEEYRYPLDAFDLIAKEGRKYGLTLCIATQRPRDIPEGILSQVGTFVVHRLTNHADREIIERACTDFDRTAMSFVPGLAEGQALLVGVDFPIPLPIHIRKPSIEPISAGPNYQQNWNQPEWTGEEAWTKNIDVHIQLLRSHEIDTNVVREEETASTGGSDLFKKKSRNSASNLIRANDSELFDASSDDADLPF